MKSPLSAKEVIDLLGLRIHPEGGYFTEVYRSPMMLPSTDTTGPRHLTTTILYLLTEDRPLGYLHRNRSDIIHYFHLGSPIQYTTLSPSGQLNEFTLGSRIEIGDLLQCTVEGGMWKGSRITEGGSFGLISESVSPGFDAADMEFGTKGLLRNLSPQTIEKLAQLIRP